MDNNYPNGANNGVNNGNDPYDPNDPRQRRSGWNGLPHFQQFSEGPTQPGAHTLPPIHSQRPIYDHGAGSFEQQTRQHPSLYSTQAAPYPNYATHASHPTYNHGMPHFPSSSSMIASSVPAIPMSQPYPPPIAAYTQIRPMPPSTSTQGHQIPQAYGGHPSFGFPSSNEEHDTHQRAHVVGSQGRRGILPSAEGKPAAVNSNGNTTAKSTVIPQKDAEGKFPCPHCTKTYLHGKHLKRHMLRRECSVLPSTLLFANISVRHGRSPLYLCAVRRYFLT